MFGHSSEDVLLYLDESGDTYLNRMSVATTVAHEFAHQWFGNHVTCEWWMFNWLNEGFAQLYQHVGLELVS